MLHAHRKARFSYAPLIFLGAFLLVACVRAAEPSGAEGVRFLSYNLENYLTMSRYSREGERTLRLKPEEEKKAVVSIIASVQPHILGVCEIGTLDDLADLQQRLKGAGVDLPHIHHAGGVDLTRKLALLSAFPIVASNSQDNLSYKLGDQVHHLRRGLLDVTLDLPKIGPTHFIGIHYKSKREISEADQALMRLNEAVLTRQHCDAILEKDPQARLVIYGDFNETRRMQPMRKIQGHYRAPNHFSDIEVADSRGEFWTHFWNYQHQYARFDYVLVSPSMLPAVHLEGSRILDPENWADASDHRAILVEFRAPQDAKKKPSADTSAE